MDPAEAHDVVYTDGGGGSDTILFQIKKALSGFLGLPLAVVLLFIVLAGIISWVDQSDSGWVQHLRQTISQYAFQATDTSGAVLGLIVSGLLTMTSLTISMLLLTLQQTAGNLGNLVYDQFMGRRRNQLYVGYIVGSVVFALLIRPTTGDAFNPVLGATTATIVALIGIILLLYFLYSTIRQMRPQIIVQAIHDDALRARRKQDVLIRRTRRVPKLEAADYVVAVRTKRHGYVNNIDAEKLIDAFAGVSGAVEAETRATIGAYVSYHDVLALVKSDELETAREVAGKLGRAYLIGGQRELGNDPVFGLQQLEVMAWTEMSTARQNPETGLMAIHSIRDLLARWSEKELGQKETASPMTAISFVYPEVVIPAALNVFESLALVSSESKQHQTLSAILLSLALLFPRFPKDARERSIELLVRILPALSKHGLTRELDYTLACLAEALAETESSQAAQLIRDARQKQAEKLPQQLSPPKPSRMLAGRPGVPADSAE